jgi:hypothetical protein
MSFMYYSELYISEIDTISLNTLNKNNKSDKCHV